MLTMIEAYWPHVLGALSVALASLAAIHATMTKTEVRSALGWVGVILLSPLLGALIYLAFGINRIRRSPKAGLEAQNASFPRDAGASTPQAPKATATEAAQMAAQPPETRDDTAAPTDTARVTEAEIDAAFGPRPAALFRLGDRVTRARVTAGNTVDLLPDGDTTFGAMVAAIEGARRFVVLESYIFDNDPAGRRIVAALAAAKARGVAVRVLIDAVGVRYSTPTILPALARAGIRAALFNGRLIIGLRLPYANLRTHRKILVADGRVALVGGMNIRAGFAAEFAGNTSSRDTHFQVSGPAVADYLAICREDWAFATGEVLEGAAWQPDAREPERGALDAPPLRAARTRVPLRPASAQIAPSEEAPPRSPEPAPMLIRVVASGPDARLETAHKLLIGAASTAEHHIRIMSPYFLPDRELISALTTAARRGVAVDIVTPAQNNLTLVDRAMQAQFDQVLRDGCRVWRARGSFDHSKLLSIDGYWSFVGSSNLDPRSLRLNFEIDSEVFDHEFATRIAGRIDAAIATAQLLTLEDLRARPFLERLMNRVFWLGSPYL